MAGQNINQYVYPNWGVKLVNESYDMSLTSDEQGYNQEVVFSPYLIAQTYGNKLPVYFDIDNPLTSQGLNLTYKNYNLNNIFVSQNYYETNDLDLNCFTGHSSCDIGLTGIDNGLVSEMTGQTINFTNGLINDSLKFTRLNFDRRLKLFQTTGYTSSPNIRFSGFDKTILYEVVSKNDPFVGKYHELYGGFYQGFYKLFGYDYDILPERMNKGWSVEMILKPRLIDEYFPGPNETTLNEIYPNNKNTFFYFGTRAENKFYHHADGTPNCFTGYTRVTTPLTGLTTCACCNKTITDSRCIYVYPPRSVNNIHDPHVNYGCNLCNGNREKKITCGCDCKDYTCETCGWECFEHKCDTIITPTPTPSPTPTPTPDNCVIIPTCTPTCTKCDTCDDCKCSTTGFTSVENTCEVDPLFDSLSNAISFRLCGDPKNPQIGVRMLSITGDCQTTGSCENTGVTFTTGYTIVDYCTPPIYPRCEQENPAWLEEEHWFQVNIVWERYNWLDECDLLFRGGLDTITEKLYLESLANNTVSLVNVPYTKVDGKTAEQIEIVKLNDRWISEKNYREGRLKIYINGKIFYTIENFEELIPRALDTDKEKQVGVPFNISWGGGTQGLRENLTFSSTTLPFGPYIQDPECFPINDLTGTTFNGLKTNILIEQNFAGTFEGAISQFRMYTSPLSAPEIKHNFKILNQKFEMFNPDCPDCSTKVCEINDFTYVITDTNDILEESIEIPHPLGRVYIPDERDKNYLIEDKLKLKNTILTTKYWDADEWWGNQENTPQCVGYAWAHWIEDGPVKHEGISPIINPTLIYKEAQKLDEWVGENYNGTSVRGGAKYLKNTNKISSYLWTYNINVLIDTVLTKGPVVVGTNWYRSMFFPDKNGLMRVTGKLTGGHAYVINGVDKNKKLFRIKNSWGKNWGKSGHAFISFSDMEKLIKQNGEVCLAIENKF
jgi:hypothetical protein